MYALTYNNQVFLTPTSWKPRYIAGIIDQDYDIKVILTTSDEQRVPFNITPEIRVLRTEETRPEINPLIETYDGPFWNIHTDKAYGTYTKKLLPIDIVKADIKSKLAAERYKKECNTFKMNLNDTEISVETDRDTRNIFMQAVLFMGDTEVRKWKFPEGFLEVTKQDLMTIISTGATVIQSAFDWEDNFVNQIDSATTHQQLLDIYNTIFPPQNGMLDG